MTTAQNSYSWNGVDTGAISRFRALSVVNSECVWLAGMDGSVVRTFDGGSTWQTSLPASGPAEFRAIAACDVLTAVVLAPGADESGAKSARLYRTEDGGSTWRCVYVAPSPNWYLDGIAFVNQDVGVVIGDPIGDRFTLLRTIDGGRSWQHIDPAASPEALPGEGAFAASGSCLVAADGVFWLGTGGAPHSRVLRSDDAGLTWTPHTVGLYSAPMAGVFGLSFATERFGFAVGGDHNDQNGMGFTVARTHSGGTQWAVLSGSAPRGYRSAVTVLPRDPEVVITVGPSIGDISYDSGESWEPLPGSFNAISSAADGSCWAAGDDGRVARLERLR